MNNPEPKVPLWQTTTFLLIIFKLGISEVWQGAAWTMLAILWLQYIYKIAKFQEVDMQEFLNNIKDLQDKSKPTFQDRMKAKMNETHKEQQGRKENG